MELDFIDMIISIIQSVFFIYMVNYCLEYNIISYYKKIIISVILLSCTGYLVTNIFGNISVCIFVTHILAMLITMYCFKNKFIEALVAYNSFIRY